MNVERLTVLRDFIEKLPQEKFDMEDWVQHFTGAAGCNTVGCIAGWAQIIFHIESFREQKENETVYDYTRERQSFYVDFVGGELGLAHDEAKKLFMPDDLSERTKAEAVEVLTNLIATGEVAWKKIEYDEED